ncbi:hypothetical protein HY493_04790 [Candidatus Woesearchaeota archaeon]|nr:hypothetical protein [Candidatus Woesearchaeota archaeon]
MSFERLRWTTGIALVLFALVASSIIGFGFLSKSEIIAPEPTIVPNKPLPTPIEATPEPPAPIEATIEPVAPAPKPPAPVEAPVTAPAETVAPASEPTPVVVRRRTRAS